MRACDMKSLVMVMVVLVVARAEETGGGGELVTWGNSYYKTWGNKALLLNKTSEIHLILDQLSGSGFESISVYGSGSFNMRVKIPDNDSTGVITSFYLISRSSRQDELSFQLLGGNGPPYILNTNMVLYGQGGREQRFHLWFDPAKDYHSYRFLWNPHQLVFYVDDTPIRVFRKNSEVYYPSVQTMFIRGSVMSQNISITNPKQMPYIAKFQAPKIQACTTTFFGIDKCSDPKFWWNRQENWQLNSREREVYINARKKYLVYDYCSDRQRYPHEPQECTS